MFATIVATNDCYRHYGGVTLVEKRLTILEMFCFFCCTTILSEVVAHYLVKYRVFGRDTALDLSTLVVNI